MPNPEHHELMERYREALEVYSDAVAGIDNLTGEALAAAMANAKQTRLACDQLRRELEDSDRD